MLGLRKKPSSFKLRFMLKMWESIHNPFRVIIIVWLTINQSKNQLQSFSISLLKSSWKNHNPSCFSILLFIKIQKLPLNPQNSFTRKVLSPKIWQQKWAKSWMTSILSELSCFSAKSSKVMNVPFSALKMIKTKHWHCWSISKPCKCSGQNKAHQQLHTQKRTERQLWSSEQEQSRFRTATQPCCKWTLRWQEQVTLKSITKEISQMREQEMETREWRKWSFTE